MSAATTDTQVRDYLTAVERFLDDLPEHERRDLLEDLEEHLTEVAAEDEGSLVDRLGPPDAYAAELRASAGLPVYVAADSLPAAERLRRSLRASPLGALASSAPVRAVRGYLPELRPTWWVVRGYLAAVVIDAVFFTRNPSDGGLPWPRIADSSLVGTLLVVVCVWLSILAGRATRGRDRFALVALAANIAIVLTFVGAFPRGDIAPGAVNLVQAEPFGALQHGDGAPIRQVCAYDEDGKRLNDVQLFDQNGRPIEVGRGKLDIIMDRVDGGPPGFRRKLAEIARDEELETFECPKKLKDLQSKASAVERGLIRKKLLRDGPLPGDAMPEKLRPFVEE